MLSSHWFLYFVGWKVLNVAPDNYEISSVELVTLQQRRAGQYSIPSRNILMIL